MPPKAVKNRNGSVILSPLWGTPRGPYASGLEALTPPRGSAIFTFVKKNGETLFFTASYPMNAA